MCATYLEDPLGVCVFALYYGCASPCMNVAYYMYRYTVLPRTGRTMCTGILYYEKRVVLCVPVLCATHCIESGIRGCVCTFLRGTCIVCTFFVCYGRAALVHKRVVLYVPVYCATRNVPYYLYRYIVLRKTCRILCTGVLCYSLHSTWDSRVCVSLTSRHVLRVYVFAVCYGCAALCMDLS